MLIHIHTQYTENYGTADAPYWKFKGGSTIVVTGFDAPLNDAIGKAAQAVVDSLRDDIEYANDMSEERVIDWELVSDGTLTPDERDQMEFDGHISDPSKRVAIGAAVPIAIAEWVAA